VSPALGRGRPPLPGALSLPFRALRPAPCVITIPSRPAGHPV